MFGGTGGIGTGSKCPQQREKACAYRERALGIDERPGDRAARASVSATVQAATAAVGESTESRRCSAAEHRLEGTTTVARAPAGVDRRVGSRHRLDDSNYWSIKAEDVKIRSGVSKPVCQILDWNQGSDPSRGERPSPGDSSIDNSVTDGSSQLAQVAAASTFSYSVFL